MDTYKLKWTRLQSEIFRFLCIHAGDNKSLRAIASSLKVSPTAVSKALPDLEKEELAKITRSKTLNLYSIELNRDTATNLKRVENLKMLYESKLDSFLYDEFPGCTIILFGSYSRGEDVWFGEDDERSSDIDIAIIGSKEKNIDLKNFKKFLNRKISLNFYKSWNDIHKHLKENLFNGIILKGEVQL